MIWLKEHVLLVAFLSLLAGGIAVIIGAIVAIRLPENYFLEMSSEQNGRRKNVGAAPLPLMILKNIVGGILIVIGVILSVPLVPGPGVLILIMGLMLTNFPGKRKIVQKLLQTQFIFQPINWLRKLSGRPPLISPTSI